MVDGQRFEESPRADWPGILDGKRGGIVYLRETGVSRCYARMSIATHDFPHVGEILTLRSFWGHVLEDNADWGRSLR